MPVREFDLVVIGSGAAGSTVAQAVRSAGRSVAIVDSRPFGGTCAQRGCDPKRILIGGAELVDWSKRFAALGIVAEAELDWAALLRFKRTFTDPVPAERERGFREAGIEAIAGRARFVDRTSLRVGDDVLRARHVVIAAGARHRTLDVPGEELLRTSTDFLGFERMPDEIVFVGGGYISFELAHLAARAGARVRILHGDARPLPGFDAELVERLLAATRALGIDVVTGARVTAVAREGSGRVVVRARAEDGTERSYEAETAVHGAGRVPEIDDLDLDAGGVARTSKGVTVNAYLQSTTNPAVYAAGDAADGGGLPLTPVAGLQGEIVAANLRAGNRRTFDPSGLVTVVFTIPALASVGMSEGEARKRGFRPRVVREDMTRWYSARRVAAPAAAAKVLVDDDADRVLGAALLGPHAEELANVLAVAIRGRVPASGLRDVLFGYPSGASDLQYLV